MKKILLALLITISLRAPAAPLDQPLASASAVVTLVANNVVVTNWNTPNAYAGVGAKLKLCREESPAMKHGALNFIATSIEHDGGQTWTVRLAATNIDGKLLPFSNPNAPAKDLLSEPFGFSFRFYFLANGIDLLSGSIDLGLNGVTNRFAIPAQEIGGNQIFITRLADKTHTPLPPWAHERDGSVKRGARAYHDHVRKNRTHE